MSNGRTVRPCRHVVRIALGDEGIVLKSPPGDRHFAACWAAQKCLVHLAALKMPNGQYALDAETAITVGKQAFRFYREDCRVVPDNGLYSPVLVQPVCTTVHVDRKTGLHVVEQTVKPKVWANRVSKPNGGIVRRRMWARTDRGPSHR